MGEKKHRRQGFIRYAFDFPGGLPQLPLPAQGNAVAIEIFTEVSCSSYQFSKSDFVDSLEMVIFHDLRTFLPLSVKTEASLAAKESKTSDGLRKKCGTE